jgi:hypothetical protein
MPKNMPPKYRDAKDGQYVTEKHADKHPNTTVKEIDKKPPPSKKK